MGIVEYPFIVITPWSTLTQNGCACFDFIFESNEYVQKLFVFDRSMRNKKETIKKQLHKNVDMNVQWMRIRNL